MIVPSIASRRFLCPSIMLCQVGAFASSKSAMNPSAPEFSALITILRSVGPVISTQRCCMSGGTGATVQSPSRISRVSGRKSSISPSASRARRRPRASSSSSRRGPNRAWSSVTNSSASGVMTSSNPAAMAP